MVHDGLHLRQVQETLQEICTQGWCVVPPWVLALTRQLMASPSSLGDCRIDPVARWQSHPPASGLCIEDRAFYGMGRFCKRRRNIGSRPDGLNN